MCKLTKNLPMQGGLLDIQEKGFYKGGQGLRPPSQLCFVAFEIECTASWQYNMQ